MLYRLAIGVSYAFVVPCKKLFISANQYPSELIPGQTGHPGNVVNTLK